MNTALALTEEQRNEIILGVAHERLRSRQRNYFRMVGHSVPLEIAALIQENLRQQGLMTALLSQEEFFRAAQSALTRDQKMQLVEGFARIWVGRRRVLLDETFQEAWLRLEVSGEAQDSWGRNLNSQVRNEEFKIAAYKATDAGSKCDSREETKHRAIRKRLKERANQVEGVDQLDPTMPLQERDQVEKVIADLTEKQRQVLLEPENITNLTPAHIRKIRSRAITKLRKAAALGTALLLALCLTLGSALQLTATPATPNCPRPGLRLAPAGAKSCFAPAGAKSYFAPAGAKSCRC